MNTKSKGGVINLPIPSPWLKGRLVKSYENYNLKTGITQKIWVFFQKDGGGLEGAGIFHEFCQNFSCQEDSMCPI